MRNEPQHEKIENIGPFGFVLGFVPQPNLPGPQRKSEMYYRRIFHFGAVCFFTVNLMDRTDCLVPNCPSTKSA